MNNTGSRDEARHDKGKAPLKTRRTNRTGKAPPKTIWTESTGRKAQCGSSWKVRRLSRIVLKDSRFMFEGNLWRGETGWKKRLFRGFQASRRPASLIFSADKNERERKGTMQRKRIHMCLRRDNRRESVGRREKEPIRLVIEGYPSKNAQLNIVDSSPFATGTAVLDVAMWQNVPSTPPPPKLPLLLPLLGSTSCGLLLESCS